MNIENLTDDVLCAYLDDELSPEARIVLERRLLSEPGARVRLDRFRESDARLHRAFALPREGDADPLLRLLAGNGATPAPLVSPPSRWRRYAAPAGLAMAATVAGLAIGLGMRGDATQDGQRNADPRMSAGLQSALDRLPSGEVRKETRILLSFRRDDGSICRQFETSARGGGAEGVACRTPPPDAGWSLIAWHQRPGAVDGYRPAGGEDSPVDAVVDEIDASGPLSAEEEARAMRHGW